MSVVRLSSTFFVLGDSFSAQKEILYIFDLRGEGDKGSVRDPGEGSRTLIRHLMGIHSSNYADYTTMSFDSLFQQQ